MARYEFNVKPLEYMVAAKKERAFKKVGAFVRSDARHSIRVSIRNSKPGQPPLAKRRTFKNTIRFEADKEGVVTGPIYAAPANSTPHILEAGGWRVDSIGRIRARWERANPEKTREQRRQENAERRERKKNGERVYSKKEIEAIRRKESAKGRQTKQELRRMVRFHIARRPYMEPAFNKNKMKTLTLLGAR